MLKSSREISERNAAMGSKPGYDVAHQTFGILGLRAAAYLAEATGNNKSNTRWKETAVKSFQSFSSHETHSFIEDGKIIKRRLLDGSVQRELQAERTKENEDFFAKFMPNEMPLSK